MPCLEIVVHQGCMSESSIRTLAQEIREALPGWAVVVRWPTPDDMERLGIAVSPVFLLDGRIIVTGIPQKDWLLSRLRSSITGMAP